MDTKYYMSHESNFDIVIMDLPLVHAYFSYKGQAILYVWLTKPGHILILGKEMLTVNHAWFEANII